MNMWIISFIIILFVSFFIWCYLNKLYKELLEIKKERSELESQIIKDKCEVSKLKNEAELLSEKNKESQQYIDNTQELANKLYQEKLQNLEKQYQEDEQYYLDEIFKLNEQYLETQQEIESLKQTKAKSIELLRQEQLAKEEQNFHRLMLASEFKKDVSILNDVKNNISKPRAISMVIWTQYYSPIAKKKIPQWIGTNTVCGIYKITNIKTQQCYIGQSKDVAKRLTTHMKAMLDIDAPAGNRLYQDAIQLNIENFSFELLESCPENKLNEKEKYWIDFYQSNKFGYNSTKGGS